MHRSQHHRGRGPAGLGRLALAAALVLGGPAGAEGLLATTHLLDIRQGSVRSEAVRSAARGGYELAGGAAVRMQDWIRAACRTCI